MDIAHLKNRLFNELSGGERQRVMLARIINRDAPIMLMDEPLNGVDLRHQHEIVSRLKRLSSSKTVLVVMHDISMAVREFSRLLFFEKGRLAYDVQAGDISEERLSEIFNVQVSFLTQNDKLFVHTELAAT